MGIKQEYQQFKQLVSQGGDLLLLRLRLLKLDATEQLASVIKIVAMIVAVAVFCLVGFIALLLGLNVVLTEEAKIWVFFGVAISMSLLSFGLLILIPIIWRNSNHNMNETLSALQQDWRLLRGESNLNNINNQDIKNKGDFDE